MFITNRDENRNSLLDFLSSPEGYLEDLLRRITATLQLSRTQRQNAEERYDGVSRWLKNYDSPLAPHDPHIFPQGSLALGTTTKPIGKNEYDLDFVMLLRRPTHYFYPQDLLNVLFEWLDKSPHYQSLLQVKRRCIRLDYADEFHMDILPAVPDYERMGTCILVPDVPNNGLSKWTFSNPLGFIDWFEERAGLANWEEELSAMRAQVDPIPGQLELHEVPPLKSTVQLVKRHRDIFFNHDMDRAPISIVLTTLCGDHYKGAGNVVHSLTGVLGSIYDAVISTPGALEVHNPRNDAEILSERWGDDPSLYSDFKDWLFGFRKLWGEILQAEGSKQNKLLKHLFGEDVVDNSLNAQADMVKTLRERGGLHLLQAGTLSISPGMQKSVRVRQHRFYGSQIL